MLKNQRGQSLIEYVILVALIGIASMATVQVLSKNVHTALKNVSNSLSTTPTKKLKRLDAGVFTDNDQEPDFATFMRGAPIAEGPAQSPAQ